MASDAAGQRYRAWYEILLRLYPRQFREQFGEQMVQTFRDMYREREGAGRSLHVFVVWMFCETLWGIVKENMMRMSDLGKMTLRVALGAFALLMVPLVASRLVKDWNWPAGAFVVVYLLFFATGMAYALIARRMGVWTYKAGVGVALFAGFTLGWSNMVHVADAEQPAYLAYYSVLAVGLIGAAIARLRARGLAWTLFAMAATMALLALVLPRTLPPDLLLRITIGHWVLVALFVASGLLFRRASAAVTE